MRHESHLRVAIHWIMDESSKIPDYCRLDIWIQIESGVECPCRPRNGEALLLSKNEGRKMGGGSMAPKFFAPHFSTDSFRYGNARLHTIPVAKEWHKAHTFALRLRGFWTGLLAPLDAARIGMPLPTSRETWICVINYRGRVRVRSASIPMLRGWQG